MKISIRRSCLSLIVLSIVIGPTKSKENETLVTSRRSRASGRIVKLYSGPKPEPFLCTEEGFKPDPIHCSVFYRCIKSSSGKFTMFKFQCGPGTVYDPEIEVCNHPSNTKRSECGGLVISVDQDVENDIELHELPSPISTILPVYVSQATYVTHTKTHATDKTPTLDNVSTSPKEQGYEYFLSTLSTPYSTKITTEKIRDMDYFSNTHEKNSTNAGSPTLGKSESCTSDGFVGDSENCKKFYRCVSSSRGGFIRYEFSCSDPTVWDDSTQSCNHPWAVRNRRCGRLNNEVTSFSDNNNILTDQIGNSYGIMSVTAPKENSTHKLQQHLNELNTENTQKNYDSHVYPTIITQENNNIEMDPSLSGDENKNDFEEITTSKSTNFSKKSYDNRVKNVYKVGKNFICTRSGFIGDKSDCIKFYRCVDSGKGSYTKYEFTCSHGTVWDKKLEACNYAWAVKECGGETSPETFTSTHNLLSTSESTIISNENINHSYMDQFNSESVATVTVTTPVLLISTTDASKLLGTECTETRFIGDINDCKRFYKCIDNGGGNFTKYEYKCGDGTAWDQNIEACNHAWAVKSCNSISSNNTLNIIDANAETSAAPQLIESTVPSELQSNNIDYNTVYGFQQGVTTQNTEITLAHNINQEANCQTAGFIGDIVDCKKFYRCVINEQGSYTRYEFSCGEGTLWDPEIEACNHAWAVKKCGASNSFQDKVTTSQINHVSYTYQTIKENDTKITTIHPSMQTNKPGKDIDDYDSGYALQQSLTTKKSDTDLQTIPQKETLFEKNYCQSPGFIGDKNNCNKFYRCVDNGNGGFIQHEFFCGEGTVWDPQIESCNHAWAVKKCGGSMASDEDGFTTPTTTSTTHINVTELNNGYITPNHVDAETTLSTNTQRTSLSDANINIECKTTGFIRDKNNCKKFYRCVDTGNGTYVKYNFSCGEGAAWDSQINACNHEWAVKDCENSSTEIFEKPTSIPDDKEIVDNYFTSSTKNDNNYTESTTPYASTAILVTVSENKIECQLSGFMGDSNNCMKFYRCVENGNGGFIRYDFLCGEGTVWDSNINSCNHRNNVEKCGGTSSHELETTTQINISLITHSDSSTTHSNNYYLSSTTQVHPLPSNDESLCKTEGFFADPNDCKKFYRCVKKSIDQYTKYNFSCVNGTIWIQEMQTCDYDMDIADCSTSASSTTTDSNYISIPTEFSNTSNTSHGNSDEFGIDKCTSEGFYPSKHNCQHFYRCVNNNDGSYTKYDFSCAEGTVWDINIQSCNYINEVKNCVSSVYPVNNTEVKPVENEHTTEYDTTKLSSASIMDNPMSITENSCMQEGYFGDTHNCQKFYRCVYENEKGYIKYDFTCGEGTIWDSDVVACNHPYDVQKPSCKSEHETASTISTTPIVSTSSTTSVVVATNAPTSLPSAIPSDNNMTILNCSNNSSTENSAGENFTCSKAGFFADHSNCKKFYRCVDWGNDGKKFSLYHFECGDGTIWDPTLETCNHESSVYPPRNCNGTQQGENTSETYTTTTEIITTINTAETSTTSFETTKITQQTTTQTTTQSVSGNYPSSESLMTEVSTTQSSTTEVTTTFLSTNKETTAQAATTTQSLTTTKEPITQLSTITETTIASSTAQESTTATTTTVGDTTASEQFPSQTTQIVTDHTTSQVDQEQTTKLSTLQTTVEYSTTFESSASTTQVTSTTADGTTTTQVVSEQSTNETPTQTTNSQSTAAETSSSATTEINMETNSSTTQKCPDTDDDQSLYICPTSFKRHPKYCNMFYQCIEDNDNHEIKIATFNCPNNTIYDESKIQCVEEGKSNEKCNKSSHKHRVKRLGAVYNDPIMVSKESLACPHPGHFPFEKHFECSAVLLKCELTDSGKLRGYVYKCPEGFVYWNISRRCEAIENVQDCKRTFYPWKSRYDIPLEKFNIAM